MNWSFAAGHLWFKFHANPFITLPAPHSNCTDLNLLTNADRLIRTRSVQTKRVDKTIKPAYNACIAFLNLEPVCQTGRCFGSNYFQNGVKFGSRTRLPNELICLR